MIENIETGKEDKDMCVICMIHDIKTKTYHYPVIVNNFEEAKRYAKYQFSQNMKSGYFNPNEYNLEISNISWNKNDGIFYKLRESKNEKPVEIVTGKEIFDELIEESNIMKGEK